jgi:glycosyltransferase involved in cell wall biosynthesis
MKVLVVGSAHIYKTPDGKYYSPSVYTNEFFQRYLNVFDEVRFIAKTKYVEEIDGSKFAELTCKGLEIYELPWYRGMKEMIKKLPKLIVLYKNASRSCNCIIYRIGQIESYFTYLLSPKKPYAVEVVNDPATIQNVSGIFQSINLWLFKRMLRNANGVSYVTESYLQKKYPTNKQARDGDNSYFETHYSSIDLDESDLRQPKKYPDKIEKLNIVHTSNRIDNNIKGHKTLIETVKIITDSGFNVSVSFIGDGEKVEEFRKYASDLGIADRVNFLGRISSRKQILEILGRSDLYVLPTYMEGLPRSIIEAKAAGLPCLSSPTAGVPELVENKYLFRPDDSQGFAQEIIRLMNNPRELEQMSRDGVQQARKYTKNILNQRRHYFYSKLRDLALKND